MTGFISGIGSWIASHKGPIDVDRQLLVPHGHAIMDGFLGALRSRMGDLQSFVSDVSSTVSGVAVPGTTGASGDTSSAPAVPNWGAFNEWMVETAPGYTAPGGRGRFGGGPRPAGRFGGTPFSGQDEAVARRLDVVIGHLRELVSVGRQQPARTAAGLNAALNGVAGRAIVGGNW